MLKATPLSPHPRMQPLATRPVTMAATRSPRRDATEPIVDFNVDRDTIPVSICTFQSPIDFIQQQKAIIKEHALSATAKGDARTETAKKRLKIASSPSLLKQKRLSLQTDNQLELFKEHEKQLDCCPKTDTPPCHLDKKKLNLIDSTPTFDTNLGFHA